MTGRFGAGDWFAVPLPSGGYAVGLLARRQGRGPVLLGYFFGPRRPSVPALDDLGELRATDAALVKVFGYLGLRSGEWPILGRLAWDAADWPVPEFGWADLLVAGRYAARRYDESLHFVGERRITRAEYEALPEDGSAGDVLVQMMLDRVLAE
jgi:hypothetical protein